MSNKIEILSLALVLALCGTARAQEGDPFNRAMEGAPPAGVQRGAPRIPPVPDQPAQGGANPLDELARDMKARPAPAQGAATRPAAAPTDATGPAGASPDAADPSVEINANYDVTMDIYQKLLEAQGMDTGGIEKRIASNEEIVARYTPEMNKTEEELRRQQVAFMNRAFQLRQQKDAGQITDEQFQKAIVDEEGKWNRKKAAIAGDSVFYRDEVTQAQARITQLKSQKVAVEQRLEREGKKKPAPKPPGDVLFEGFNGTLDRLSGFQTRFAMDGKAHDEELIKAGVEKD